jgi:hypothetical protein
MTTTSLIDFCYQIPSLILLATCIVVDCAFVVASISILSIITLISFVFDLIACIICSFASVNYKYPCYCLAGAEKILEFLNSSEGLTKGFIYAALSPSWISQIFVTPKKY